jgi:hypothetical protein
MKVLRCCVIILVSTLIFASCRPNGSVLNGTDTMVGTPSKSDTVLPLKYHTKSDTAKKENENLPTVLKR